MQHPRLVMPDVHVMYPGGMYISVRHTWGVEPQLFRSGERESMRRVGR